jgi:hypothetical protein
MSVGYAGQLIGTTGQTGNKTYLVSGPNPATQYFTLGNGGSIQYADGVTPAAPKAYNDFSDVIYNSNVPYTKDEITDAASDNAAVGEGFAIVTADECVMQASITSSETGKWKVVLGPMPRTNAC